MGQDIQTWTRRPVSINDKGKHKFIRVFIVINVYILKHIYIFIYIYRNI
jgi:hypothetical protein